MKKVYVIFILFVWAIFYTHANTTNASFVCQDEYNRINELKIELANLQEQYVWWKIEAQVNELYTTASASFKNAIILSKYKEWADKESLLIVQINKQITVYQICISNEKANMKSNLDNAESDLNQAKSKLAQMCYNMNAVPNAAYTNCECVIWTSYSSSVWKCITETLTPKCYDLVNGYIWSDNGCYCKLWYSWEDSIKKCKDNGTIPSVVRLKAQVQFDRYKKQYIRFTQSIQKTKYNTLLTALQKKTKTLKWDNQKINNLIIELVTAEIAKL